MFSSIRASIAISACTAVRINSPQSDQLDYLASFTPASATIVQDNIAQTLTMTWPEPTNTEHPIKQYSVTLNEKPVGCTASPCVLSLNDLPELAKPGTKVEASVMPVFAEEEVIVPFPGASSDVITVIQSQAAKKEAARIAAEKEAARVAAEQEAARIAAEKEAARVAAEKAEADRIAAEKAKAARIAAEKAEADRIAAEKAKADALAEQKAKDAAAAKAKALADKKAKEAAAAKALAEKRAAEARAKALAEKRAAEARAKALAEQRAAAAKKEAEIKEKWSMGKSSSRSNSMYFAKWSRNGNYIYVSHDEMRSLGAYSKWLNSIDDLVNDGWFKKAFDEECEKRERKNQKIDSKYDIEQVIRHLGKNNKTEAAKYAKREYDALQYLNNSNYWFQLGQLGDYLPMVAQMAHDGSHDAVRKLIDMGADMDVATTRGGGKWNSLSIACDKKNWESMRLVVEVGGADPDTYLPYWKKTASQFCATKSSSYPSQIASWHRSYEYWN